MACSVIHNTYIASDLEACQLLIDNATNLTSTISQVLYRTQSASLRVAKETRKKLGLTQMAQTDPITGKHDKVSVAEILSY